MSIWKTAAVGGRRDARLVWLAARPPPRLSPHESCTKTVDARRSACRDELLEQDALVRLMGCNIAADHGLASCQAGSTPYA